MACLAKDPADRPQHLDELVASLETVVTPSGGSAKTGAQPITAEPIPVAPSIAVLPFKNMSADPENEYFADGMTEEIINSLAQVDGLRVASRTSAFAFKDRELDIREIGDQLNVATVLEGSVRSAGKRMRVTAQLVKAADGYHLWSQRYDRDMDDIFAVQDEIAAAISGALTSTLNPVKPIGVQRAIDVEAYKLYLKGRFHWNKRTNEAMRKAIQLFEQSLERDPTYARAYAGIADCYGLLGWVAFGALPPQEAFPKAEAAARRALEMDDTLAEAHNTLGWTRLVYGWDWEEAEREFTRAIELSPRYAMAHSWYALHLIWTGRVEEAIDESARAMELDPLSLIIQILAAWVRYFAGRYDESIELCRRALEMDPNYLRAHLGIGWAQEGKGDFEAAIQHFSRGEALSGGSPRFVAALGHAHAVSGDRDKAKAALERLNALREWTFVSPAYVANVHVGLGDTDGTFAMLEEAFETRSGALVYLARDPQFEPVRADARFDALLAKIGLPQQGGGG
jgi:serine/threonine-protein kinase